MRWGKRGAVLLLVLASLAGTRTLPARRLFFSAQQFFSYYRALERADLHAGLWERAALSLAMASADSGKPACSESQSTSF